MARRRRPLPPQPQLVGLAVLLSVAVSAAAKTDQPDGEGLRVGKSYRVLPSANAKASVMVLNILCNAGSLFQLRRLM